LQRDKLAEVRGGVQCRKHHLAAARKLIVLAGET
jgi:hypothetical protein